MGNPYQSYGSLSGTAPKTERQDGDAGWRGVNNRLSPELLEAGWLADAENTRCTTGPVGPRRGVVKPGWLNVTASAAGGGIGAVGTFYGCGVFRAPDGRVWVLLAADGAVFRCREHNARFQLAMPDPAVKILSACTFTQAFNKVFCFRGRYLAPLVLNDIDTGFEDLAPRWVAATQYDAAVLALEQLADEIAYGPFQPVSTLTSVGDLATVVTSGPHGYLTGADVVIQGAVQTEYNGRWNITVVDEFTFTFQFPGSATTPATGTIVVSNNSHYWKAAGSQVTLTSLNRKILKQDTLTTLDRKILNQNTLASLTQSGGVATATSASHGLSSGDTVTITGATPSGYNGVFLISVTDINTFTFIVSSALGSPATGTITFAKYSTTLATGTKVNHGFFSGDTVTMAGATSVVYNGTFVVNVTSDNTFDYALAYDPGGAATGTITATKYSTTLATAVKAAHGFSNGQYVTVTGADQAAYNVTGLISNAASGTFDYALLGDPGVAATGTIKAQTSVVFAGQDPDTNPEAWARIYDILPNADDALYVNNRLLVPTAYTPGTDGYDSTSYYGKKDFLVATDVLDPIHFDFSNEFRINEGDDSEIECLVKYDNNTVLVLKGKVWGILSNIRMDITQCTFDLRPNNYGVCGPRAAVAAGKDVIFMTTKRGLVSLNQTVNGEIQGVDLPFSNDVSGWIEGIDWTQAAGIRLAYWDNKLYAAIPGAVLVYDYLRQGWAGRDLGEAAGVREWFIATYNGRDRLFYTSTSGYVNMVEEADCGDQVPDTTTASQLGWAEIATKAVTRGYLLGETAPKRFLREELSLQVWNAEYTLTATAGGTRRTQTLLTAKSFSRTAYLQPFDRPAWDASNVNDDWATPGRGDYSVALPDAGMYLGSGVNLLEYQTLYQRASLRMLPGQFVQFALAGTRGQTVLKSIGPAAIQGARRKGVII